jgi:hypothetical protein
MEWLVPGVFHQDGVAGGGGITTGKEFREYRVLGREEVGNRVVKEQENELKMEAIEKRESGEEGWKCGEEGWSDAREVEKPKGREAFFEPKSGYIWVAKRIKIILQSPAGKLLQVFDSRNSRGGSRLASAARNSVM